MAESTKTKPDYSLYIYKHFEKALKERTAEWNMERAYEDAIKYKTGLESRWDWKSYALSFGLIVVFQYFGAVIGCFAVLGIVLWIFGRWLANYLSLIHNQLLFITDRLGPDLKTMGNPFENTTSFLYKWLESRHWIEWHEGEDKAPPSLEHVLEEMLEQKLRRYGLSEDEILTIQLREKSEKS